MKSLIYAAAILLLVNACTGESSEPAPVAKTEQAEQTESDNQVDQVKQREREPQKTDSASAYQNAIQAMISKSSKDKDNKDKDSKDKDSNDDKDG